MEVWLRTNARAVWFGMAFPAGVCLLGLLLVLGLPERPPAAWMRVVGAALLAVGLATIGALAWQLRQPRLAFADGHLLVRLRSGAPIRVPITAIECFWLGQAPTMLPGKQHEHSETSAVVIRVADRATEWQRQDVKPQLGKWCEGYITIRGTWCEPLNITKINRLNERLAEVTRAAQAEQRAVP